MLYSPKIPILKRKSTKRFRALPSGMLPLLISASSFLWGCNQSSYVNEEQQDIYGEQYSTEEADNIQDSTIFQSPEPQKVQVFLDDEGNEWYSSSNVENDSNQVSADSSDFLYNQQGNRIHHSYCKPTTMFIYWHAYNYHRGRGGFYAPTPYYDRYERSVVHHHYNTSTGRKGGWLLFQTPPEALASKLAVYKSHGKSALSKVLWNPSTASNAKTTVGGKTGTRSRSIFGGSAHHSGSLG